MRQIELVTRRSLPRFGPRPATARLTPRRWISDAEARRLGYAAMQFNFVVSTNETAVELWRRLGFDVVGTLPHAFQHPRLGMVDAYVMYRAL